MTILFIWYFLLFVADSLTNLYVPQKFGLLTVTHTRNGDISQFKKYLQRYSKMECQTIIQIVIVWNNQQSVQSFGIPKNDPNWKRPIYFLKTEKNSMDLRYQLPKQSISQVYFNIDDDISVTCQELQKSFKVWQSNAVGVLGPIVSYGPRHFEWTIRSEFKYGKVKTKDIFTFGLISQAFLSRHYLQLYYADIKQIKKMRKLIAQLNNCDDIGLAWMINYFYPQFNTIIVKGNLQNISPVVAQSTSKTHYPYRQRCIRQFIDIFGQMSLKYLPVNDSTKQERMEKPLRRQFMLLRMIEIQSNILKKQKLTYNLTYSQIFTARNQIVQSLQNKSQDELKKSINELIFENQLLKQQIKQLQNDEKQKHKQIQSKRKTQNLAEKSICSQKQKDNPQISQRQWNYLLQNIINVLFVIILILIIAIGRQVYKLKYLKKKVSISRPTQSQLQFD